MRLPSTDTETPCRRVALSVRASPAGHLVAQEAVVDEDAVEAVAQHLVHQRRRDGAVHAAGQRADDVLLGAHLRGEPMQSMEGRGSSNFVHSMHSRMTGQIYACQIQSLFSGTGCPSDVQATVTAIHCGQDPPL